MSLTLRALLWLLVWVCALAQAQGLQPIPDLAARVTDRTGTLSTAASQRLEERLAQFEARKGAQLAVLLVPTTQPEEIEQYALRVVEKWKLGRAKVDDGALLIVAKDDRRVRIEVGYGLEGALSDIVSKRIVEEDIVPRFRAGDFQGGVEAGAERIMRVIDGEALPPPRPRARAFEGGSLQSVLIMVAVLSLVVGGFLRALVGRLPAALIVGSIAGVGGWLLLGMLMGGLAVGLVAFIFTLITGGAGRGWHTSSGGWHSGSGGFGGGGFGGGGGGFGGGGGGFGGGGASGRW